MINAGRQAGGTDREDMFLERLERAAGQAGRAGGQAGRELQGWH
jgi:hypothetical protein